MALDTKTPKGYRRAWNGSLRPLTTSQPDAPKTYGDLKRILAGTPRGDWPSRVNSSLTRSQALDILTAAIRMQPDERAIENTIKSDLITRNILRECRSRGSE